MNGNITAWCDYAIVGNTEANTKASTIADTEANKGEIRARVKQTTPRLPQD